MHYTILYWYSSKLINYIYIYHHICSHTVYLQIISLTLSNMCIRTCILNHNLPLWCAFLRPYTTEVVFHLHLKRVVLSNDQLTTTHVIIMLQRPATLSVLCFREVELVRVLDSETHSGHAEMGLEGATTSCPIMKASGRIWEVTPFFKLYLQSGSKRSKTCIVEP